MTYSAIYPGTFDPVTLGHEDLISRAARIFDRVTVAVAREASGKEAIFSTEERIELIREGVQNLDGVQVELFDGLLVDYVRSNPGSVLVRGLRAFSDFEYEFQMALMNRKMSPEVETMFLMTKEDFSYVSSSLVREVARLGGDVSHFVSPHVGEALRIKFGGGESQ